MDIVTTKTIAEHNFVFSLWKQPSLYAKYMKKLSEYKSFFSHKDAEFFYVLGKHMFSAGFQTFDEASVLTFLSGNETAKQVFEEKGGYRTYDTASKILSTDNIDAYFNEVVKGSCILELQNIGIDISKDYAKLTQMSVDEMRAYYQFKLNNIFLEKGANTHVEDMFITDDDLDFLNSGAQMGLSIASTAPLLNYEILGINRGLTFVGGTINAGKTSFSVGVIVKGFLNSGIKTVLISNEQTIMEFKQLFLAMCVAEIKEDIDRRRIKIGHYNTKEYEILQRAKALYNERYAPNLKFAKIFDYSMEDVQTIITTMSARGYKGFIYDVFKAEDGTSGKVIEEMKEMSKELFKTSDACDAHTVATIQLGLSFSDVRFLHMGVISTSKHITEPATEVLLLRDMWEDECTGEKFDIKPYNYMYDKNGQKMTDKATGEPIKRFFTVSIDEYKQMKLLFLAKTRNTDRGTCLLYKFDGSINSWTEIGYCTPSYENRNKKQ